MGYIEIRHLLFQDEIPEDIGPARELLEHYSRLPASDIDGHLYDIREKAWGIARYPCIGRWRFLYLPRAEDPRYQQVLRRLKNDASGEGDTLLDLGCCMGQVLRQFAYDGVDSSRLFGSDLHRQFIDVGYDLFCDRNSLRATFVVGDMLDPTDKRLRRLDGRINIVHAGSFWHLFNWEQQFMAAVRLVGFLQTDRHDAIIYGRQVGSVRPSPPPSMTTREGGSAAARRHNPYLHDRRSFQLLWNEVGAKTGTRWWVELEHEAELPMQIPGLGNEARVSRYIVYQRPC